MARNSPIFQGSAAPPPLRVTLGTGQPKFRSMWSARSSSTSIRTAAPTVTGSTPYSWTLRGDSSGPCWISCSETGVRSTRAREVTISLTRTPGPPYAADASRQSWRNAVLVMPAIGASTTGVAITRVPSRNDVMPPL